MSGSYTPRSEWLAHDWFLACIAAAGLCIQRCGECGTWRHPPRRFCPSCSSDDAAFEPVSGTGRVVSFVVSHRSLDPGWNDETPYVTLVVELDEGPRVLAASSHQPDDVAAGQIVAITVEPRGEDFALLWGTADPARGTPSSDTVRSS